MNYNMTSNGAFPLVVFEMNQDEKLKIESGSMAYHNNLVELKGKTNSSSSGASGLIKAFGKSVVTGESMLITEVRCTENGGKIAIAPKSIGAIKELNITEENWRLNDGAFLACDDTVSYKLKKQSLGKAILGGTGGLFVMETYGEGTMLINCFGDMIELEVEPDKPLVIDNEHVLAWTHDLDYTIKSASGTFGFMSGEGLVNEFNGKGKVLVQTRNLSGLASLLSKFLPGK